MFRSYLELPEDSCEMCKTSQKDKSMSWIGASQFVHDRTVGSQGIRMEMAMAQSTKDLKNLWPWLADGSKLCLFLA